MYVIGRLISTEINYDKCYVSLLSQTSLSNSVWGSVNTSTCTNWGSDSIWGDTHNSNMGFWDEAVKEAVQQPPPPKKASTQKNNKGNANLRYLLRSHVLVTISVEKHDIPFDKNE